MARGAVLQLKLIENFIRVCTTYSIEHEKEQFFMTVFLAYATKCVLFTPYVTQLSCISVAVGGSQLCIVPE